MTTLEAQKQLLITESEMNRDRLTEEWADLKFEVCELAEHARPIRSFFSGVSSVVSAFVALRRAWPEHNGRNNGKRSFVSRMLNGVQTGAALWQAFRKTRAP